MFHSFYGGRTGPRGPVGPKGDKVTITQTEDQVYLDITIKDNETGIEETQHCRVKGAPGEPFRTAAEIASSSSLGSEGAWIAPDDITILTDTEKERLNEGWGLIAQDTKKFYYWIKTSDNTGEWVSLDIATSGNDIHLDAGKALYIKNNAGADCKIINVEDVAVSGQTRIKIGTNTYGQGNYLDIGSNGIYTCINGNVININSVNAMTLDGNNSLSLKATSNIGIDIVNNDAIHLNGKTIIGSNTSNKDLQIYGNVSSTGKISTSDTSTNVGSTTAGSSAIEAWNGVITGQRLRATEHIYLTSKTYGTTPTDHSIFTEYADNIPRTLVASSVDTTNKVTTINLGGGGQKDSSYSSVITIGNSTVCKNIQLNTSNKVDITGGLSISGAITKVANITVTNGISAGQTISTSGNIIGANIKSKGNATQPIYFNSEGVAVATTYQLNKTVPANAVFTDTVTTVAKSGNGNVITGMTATNGKITYTMDNALLASGGTLNGNLILNGSYTTSSVTVAKGGYGTISNTSVATDGSLWFVIVKSSDNKTMTCGYANYSNSKWYVLMESSSSSFKITTGATSNNAVQVYQNLATSMTVSSIWTRIA